ncbi:MAG: hypothetical protein JSU86_03550 [Phycisphaerales bacterium]|nr:MAG: hypothetical protein JSU86_03550 [Phycisphaerales bacterium]
MKHLGMTLRDIAVVLTTQLIVALPVHGVECNDNCDREAGECDVTGNDCDDNGVPDEIDIACETSQDCNENRIPDKCELTECQPIDVVFLFDTSRSMNQLPLQFADFCLAAVGALAQLESEGICVRSEKLAMWPIQEILCTES